MPESPDPCGGWPRSASLRSPARSTSCYSSSWLSRSPRSTGSRSRRPGAGQSARHQHVERRNLSASCSIYDHPQGSPKNSFFSCWPGWMSTVVNRPFRYPRVNPSAALRASTLEARLPNRRSREAGAQHPDSGTSQGLSVERVTEWAPLDSVLPGRFGNYPGAGGSPFPYPQPQGAPWTLTRRPGHRPRRSSSQCKTWGTVARRRRHSSG